MICLDHNHSTKPRQWSVFSILRCLLWGVVSALGPRAANEKTFRVEVWHPTACSRQSGREGEFILSHSALSRMDKEGPSSMLVRRSTMRNSPVPLLFETVCEVVPSGASGRLRVKLPSAEEGGPRRNCECCVCKHVELRNRDESPHWKFAY